MLISIVFNIYIGTCIIRQIITIYANLVRDINKSFNVRANLIEIVW